MAISKALAYLPLERLLLDPQNPRLGRDKRREGLDQDRLLHEMSSWTLEELIDSFAQAGGFWTQDALIVVAEKSDQGPTGNFIVIEGNRRLAALKLLYKAISGQIEPPRWLAERLTSFKPSLDDELFTNLPVLEADSRDDVLAYLGFRHVTGIKEWRPAEKAEFISTLVDEKKLTFREVARQIGSRSDTVRQNYLAFKMLLQMEEMEGFDWSEVESRFSLLFLSIRSEGTRGFLGVELRGDAPEPTKPIPDQKQDDAKQFATWLFGTRDRRAIVRDSRNVDKFGEILATPRAVEYLRKTVTPDFETAYSLTASADLVVDPLNEAARQIRLALSEIDERGVEDVVKEAAWPVVESSIALAQKTGDNLVRAREMLVAA
jgi:hypothetical protein